MMNLEMNKKYLVRDKEMTVSQIYPVEFKASQYKDLVIVKDYLYNEEFYLTWDEVYDLYEILKEA